MSDDDPTSGANGIASSVRHRRAEAPKLGMVCLDVPAPEWCGRSILANTGTYGFELIYETVAGAWPETVIAGDQHLDPAFTAAAKRLEARGAKAIIGDCGFMVAYQTQVAEAVRIPVALSSLAALPMLSGACGPADAQLGILTYDARSLTRDHLTTVWPAYREDLVVIEDIRDTASWKDWASRNPAYDFETAMADVMAAAHRLFDSAPALRALVIECTCMVLFRTRLRREFGVPVVDIATVADFLMASMTQNDAAARFDRERMPANTS